MNFRTKISLVPMYLMYHIWLLGRIQ